MSAYHFAPARRVGRLSRQQYEVDAEIYPAGRIRCLRADAARFSGARLPDDEAAECAEARAFAVHPADDSPLALRGPPAIVDAQLNAAVGGPGGRS